MCLILKIKMTLANIFQINLTSGLLQYALHILNFLWFDISDMIRIQNVTTFLRTFYVRYYFKVFRFCTQLCFHLYFEYSHVSRNWKDCCMINTWDKLWTVVLLLWIFIARFKNTICKKLMFYCHNVIMSLSNSFYWSYLIGYSLLGKYL